MAVWTEATEVCNQIKVDVQSPSQVRTDNLGLLEALYSSENLAAGLAEIEMAAEDNGDGRRKTYFYNRFQRNEPADVTVGGTSQYCVTTPDRQKYRNSVTFAPTDKYEVSFTISNDKFRGYCDDESKRILLLNELNMKIKAIQMRIEQALAAQFLVLAGNLVGGAALITGNAFLANAPQLGYNTFVDLVNWNSQQMEVGEQVLMVGDGLMTRYTKVTGTMCCNNQGFELGNAFRNNDILFYRSPNVSTALGGNPNDCLVWAPGSCVPLNWIRNRGEFDTGSTDNQKALIVKNSIDTFITAPIGNSGKTMPFDMSIRYVDCVGDSSFVITIGTWCKLFAEPATETFQAGSRLVGTNGLFRARPVAA